MATTPAFWAVRLRTVLWFLLCIGFLLALPVLLDVSVWLLVAVILVAALIAAPLTWLTGAVRRARPRFSVRRWIASGVATAFVLGTLIAIPVYYFAFTTALRPMIVPQVVLANGTRTVVFQGMVHVASDTFYKSIIYELENAITQGYVLFYEGVVKSPGEGDEWFAAHLAGGKDLSASYAELGRICGLRFQNDFLQVMRADMAEHPERHVNADASTLDMKHEADRIGAEDPAFLRAMQQIAEPHPSKSMIDPSSLEKFMAALEKRGTPGQRALMGTLCRGFMTRSLSGVHDDAAEPINRVVLDFRNRVLARHVLESPHQKIFITYGAEHLRGFVAELQRGNPGWRVESVKWFRAIESPEDLHGVLGVPMAAFAASTPAGSIDDSGGPNQPAQGSRD